MDIMKQFAASGIVPVVVLENAEDAVPTAKALLAGGITTMEITFRTAAAADSIKAVAGPSSPSPRVPSSSSPPATMRRPWPGAWRTTSP